MKLVEKDAKKAKEDRQKLLEEKNKLKHDISLETERSRTRKGQVATEQHEKLQEELQEARSLMYPSFYKKKETKKNKKEKEKRKEREMTEKSESIERDTRKMQSKSDQLKGEASGLSNSLVGQTLQQQSQDHLSQTLLNDKANLQRLLGQLTSLQGRLEANLLLQSSPSTSDLLDLQVEADVLRKRKEEVEGILREEIKKHSQ